jgi:hypothetical protein|tara:strand:- start:146 stop:847 length:702 start_codon:yes stop_codon:yes gene_type:complete
MTTEKEKKEKLEEANRRWKETKAERAERIAREIEQTIPEIDVGQFDGLRKPKGAKYTKKQILELCERVRQGLDLHKASIIANVEHEAMRKAVRKYRRSLREEEFTVTPWVTAVGYSIDRAYALRILRWQMIAETGGKGSHTAMWMLERRGGESYAPPTKHKKITTESKSLTVNANLSIEQSIQETQKALNLDPKMIEASGDYWAKIITANQTGKELPAPPVINVTPTHEDSEE